MTKVLYRQQITFIHFQDDKKNPKVFENKIKKFFFIEKWFNRGKYYIF